MSYFPFIFSLCLTSLIACSAFGDTRALPKPTCLEETLRNLPTPKTEPADWQRANAVISNALPRPYQNLLLENKIALQLRKQHGLGERLEFAILHYDSKVENALETAKNGSEIQAVYLKKVLTQIFPQSKVVSYLEDSAPKPNLLRTQIVMKVGDSAVTGRAFNWRMADGSLDPSLIEMSALKSANPGPDVASKAQIRKAFNIREDANVVSIYGSARTDSEEMSSFVRQALRADNVDTVIVSSNHHEAIRHQLQRRMRNVFFANSDEVLPSRPGEKMVIVNQTRGMLPAVHAAADRAVVLGSPNIVEPINVGIPTIAFRQAEDHFDQAIWKKQTDLIAATGGGHIVNTVSEALDLVEKPQLPKPTRKTYEITDTDGTSAVDRLLTNIAKVIRH